MRFNNIRGEVKSLQPSDGDDFLDWRSVKVSMTTQQSRMSDTSIPIVKDEKDVYFTAKSGVFGCRIDGKSIQSVARKSDFPLKNMISQPVLQKTLHKEHESPSSMNQFETSSRDQSDISNNILNLSLHAKKIPRCRRCSDTELLRTLQSKTDESTEEKRTNRTAFPSQYKSKRRGTYAAAYDPQMTVRKHSTRSKSMFIRSEDIIFNNNNNINNDFMKNHSNKIQTIHGSLENSPIVPSDRKVVKNNKDTNNFKNVAVSPSMKRWRSLTQLTGKHLEKNQSPKKERRQSPSFFKDLRQRQCSLGNIHHNIYLESKNGERNKYTIDNEARNAINRTYRALSSFDGLSKQGMELIEKKYERAKRRAQSINNSSGNLFAQTTSSDESTSSRDDTANGTSCVHEAVKRGDIVTLQQLINNGHDVNSIDSHGRLPCDYALMYGYFNCLTLLIKSGASLREYFERRRVKYFN